MDEGGGFTKLIMSILALMIVSGIAYRLLKDERVFNVLFPEQVFGSEARQLITNMRNGVTRVVDPVIAPVVDQGQAIIQKVIDTVTGGVDDTVEQVKQQSLNSVKSIIHKNLAVIEDTLGTAPQQENRESNNNWVGGSDPRQYPPVISINTPQIIEAIQAAQTGQSSETVAAKLGLPEVLQAVQGKSGVLLMKDEAASSQSEKPVFVVLWEQAQTTFENIGSAIAATFQNIFGYSAEYRMSIPITKNGVTKNYRVYIIVE